MAVSRQNVKETIADVIAWRPAFETVLLAFEPILAAQAELAEKLSGTMKTYGLILPKPQAERMHQGVSLLSGQSLKGISGAIRVCAAKLLPLLGAIDALSEHIPALSKYFLAESTDKDSRDELAEAIVSGNSTTIDRVAEEQGIDPDILEFIAVILVSPVLKALTLEALPEEGDSPWDLGNEWSYGYCPVCGSLPSIGWLDKPSVEAQNAFLAGGGGKKHLHCGLCGADWKFRRGACPACNEDGSGVIEMLHESGVTHGERLDWCTKCKAYCPTVDLRDREFVPNPDAAALGMMHLDMVATRKKLRPLKPSFWNMF